MSNYPVFSGQRFAWDIDGTRVARKMESGLLYEFSDPHKAVMNSTSDDLVAFPAINSSEPDKVYFVFPEARTITSIFVACSYSANDAFQDMHRGIVGNPASPFYNPGPGVRTPVRGEVSTNTTNGVDGTWTQISFTGGTPFGYHFYNNNPLIPSDDEGSSTRGVIYMNLAPADGNVFLGAPESNYNGLQRITRQRQATITGSVSGIKGLRLFMEQCGHSPSTGEMADYTTSLGKPLATTFSGQPPAWAINCIEIYGTKTSELEFWHPTLNQALTLANTDQGDVGAPSTGTFSFRLKNNGSKQANDVAVDVNVWPLDANPSLLGQILLSLDNVTFSDTVILDSLAAGAISPVIYGKRTTPANAQYGTYSARIEFDVRNWT